MKKTGNFCIRALCAIFVGVVLGCSGGGGGSDIENNGDDSKVEHKFIADICGEEHKCQVAGCTEHGYTHPTYMNVTNEFEGQRFVEAGKNWSNNSNGNQEFTTRYNDASTYIDCKVTELSNLWRENNTGSALSNQIGNALNNFNNGTSISEKINNNYTALAPVFATVLKQYDFNNNNDVTDYYRFQASYYKLAANAYNKSLGHWEDSEDNRVLTNKEMKKTDSGFAYVLKAASLEYNELDIEKATEIMNSTLTITARNTGTNSTVLKKVIELALYNESLYGLNDLAKLDQVVSNETLREHKYFDNKITTEYNKAQNIDNGLTM